jgi:hypothetical protein
MLLNKFMKKSTCIFSYIILLYYLLPFRPAYIYYSSQQKSASSFYYNLSENKKTFADNKCFKKNDDTFPKKGRIRFDLDDNFKIDPVFEGLLVAYKKVISSESHIQYVNPLVYCNSNRGPPTA